MEDKQGDDKGGCLCDDGRVIGRQDGVNSFKSVSIYLTGVYRNRNGGQGSVSLRML